MFLQYWSVLNSNTAFYTLTVRNKKGRFGGRGSKKIKQKEAVFPTTSSFFEVAGSRSSSSSSSDINVSSSHLGAEDASQTFAHLRQWESTSIIVPFFSSWADLVYLHFKYFGFFFGSSWIPDGCRCWTRLSHEFQTGHLVTLHHSVQY